MVTRVVIENGQAPDWQLPQRLLFRGQSRHSNRTISTGSVQSPPTFPEGRLSTFLFCANLTLDALLPSSPLQVPASKSGAGGAGVAVRPGAQFTPTSQVVGNR